MVVSCSCCNDKSLFAQLTAVVIVMADDAVCSSEEGVAAVVAISCWVLLFGKQCGEGGGGGCCKDVGCFCNEDDCFGFADGEELMVVEYKRIYEQMINICNDMEMECCPTMKRMGWDRIVG